jgi:hypothetical protein
MSQILSIRTHVRTTNVPHEVLRAASTRGQIGRDIGPRIIRYRTRHSLCESDELGWWILGTLSAYLWLGLNLRTIRQPIRLPQGNRDCYCIANSAFPDIAVRRAHYFVSNRKVRIYLRPYIALSSAFYFPVVILESTCDEHLHD